MTVLVISTQLLFWLSVAGLSYIYAGYPLLVWMASRLRLGFVRDASSGTARIDSTPGGADDASSQQISIVIVGYNEAHRLTAKLDSLFASDGADRIAEVLIGSDGSTDETAQIVEAYPSDRVRLIAFGERRGKAAILNDVVPQCISPIVVLTDARQALEPSALSKLSARLSDERIGVVSGELMFRSMECATGAAEGVGAYWRYEKFIRKSESRFRSVPGATGALYTIRRELFRPVPANTLLDDVVIPMQAIEQGYRCVLESGAVAWDTPSQSAEQEAVRKRRTIAGCVQLIVNQPRWLLPWCNPIWWEFVSHKLARLVSPLLMAIALTTNVMLAHRPLFFGLLLAQGLFYASAVAGGMLQKSGRNRWLGVSLMFVSLNLTTVAALWDAVQGRFRATWQKTA